MSKSTLLATRRPRKKQPARARAAPAAIYSVHPGIAMVQKWIAELPAKTGRSLEGWLAHIRKCGPRDEMSCHAWLIEEHQLGNSAAWWLVEKAFAGATTVAEETPEGYLQMAPLYVERMYAGPKKHLRTLHDTLVELARGLGDVRICPCKTIVPLYRRHVFAQIRPATTRRIDLGLALGEEPFTSRLLDTGGRAKKDRITHRVALTALDDIDLQVRRWLKQAYERDA